MRVTVTGADGLLGSNIVRQLLAAGHRVRVFLQEGKKSPTLDGLDIERVYGDILEPRSLSEAFAHSQAVIHAAANTSIWPPRSELVRRINVQGTANAMDAAENAQIDRFVFIGTANSFTPGTKDAPGDETTPYFCGKYGLDYMDSKYEAHCRVLEAVRTRGLPALIINPTFMIGPYDSTPSSGMMLIRLYQGKIPGYTAGGRCWTHVRDVAGAAVNACSMGEIGESYIAGNVNLSYGEFFSLAADVIGVSPPRMKTPDALAIAIGTFQSALSAVTRRPPLLSRQAARISADGHYFDPSKARKALAMTATPLEIAVRDCFEWLKAHRYLERFA